MSTIIEMVGRELQCGRFKFSESKSLLILSIDQICKKIQHTKNVCVSYTRNRTHCLFSLVKRIFLSLLLMQSLLYCVLPPVSGYAQECLIDLLQDERANVEQKIEALEAMGVDNTQSLARCLQAPSRKEPIFLTILDLSRHTNRRLASEAQEIANSTDFNNIVAEQLVSADEGINNPAFEALAYRIERSIAQEILQKARRRLENVANNEKARIQSRLDRLKEQIQSPEGTRILIPTESSQGDRYYVKAEWSPSNRKTVTCLTKLFNKALITQRTLKDEERLMNGKSNRHIYWYSKDWALWIADEIERCGGRASFIGLFFAKMK